MSTRFRQNVSDASGFKDVDLGYHSDVWDTGALPSQAFIVSNIGTMQGFGLLHAVILTGHTHAFDVLNKVRPVIDQLQATCQRTYAIFLKLEEIVVRLNKDLQLKIEHNQPGIQDAEADLMKHLNIHKNAYIGHQKMSDQYDAAVEYYDKCVELIGCLELLYRVWSTLDNIHKQYGAAYVKDRAAVAKLTVAMKCLDGAWAEMRTRYHEMKEAEGAEANLEHYEFPFGEFAEYES